MARDLVTVEALKSFTYEGRAIAPGQLVTMRVLDAALSARRGEISRSRVDPNRLNAAAMVPEQASEPEPKSEPAVTAQRSRRYRRRDMVAESPGSPE